MRTFKFLIKTVIKRLQFFKLILIRIIVIGRNACACYSNFITKMEQNQ